MAVTGTVLALGDSVLVTVAGAALGTEQTTTPEPIVREPGNYVPMNWPSAGKPFSYS